MQSNKLTTVPGKDKNLSNSIYCDLKEQIMELRLPPETTLIERSLADSYGTSRTPVREALKRLAQEGWICWQERRRAIVRGINQKDVHEILMLREMIEVFTIQTVFSMGEPRVLAGLLVPFVNSMKNNIDDPIAFYKEDMNFHSTAIEHIQNERLNEIWRQIQAEIFRIAIFSTHERRQPETIILEHENIINSFWKRDRDKALHLIKYHHSMVQEAFEMTMDKNSS